MGSGMLSIGVTGIHAAQLALEATQHNIANVNTPGYSRQYIQQSAGIPQLTGSGYFGSGTTVDTVRRSYDKFLTMQTASAQSSVSELSTYLAKISQIDNMLGDSTSGLAPAMQSFFTGVQQVAANPSLISARQSMLSNGQTVVSQFNGLAGRLNELYSGVNGEISNEVSTINSYLSQIADVNGQISRAEAATNQPPNDLLDMRDQMVNELNKHLRVQTAEDSSGNLNVFMSNGQPLVVGNAASTLTVERSTADPERFIVGLKSLSGQTQVLDENRIEGGALGGLMRFRRESLDDAANSLGQIAISLALTFNAQQAIGQDLDGLNKTSVTSGFQAEFFTVPEPKVIPGSTTADPVTASFLAPSVSASGNFYTNLTGSDYVLRATSATSITLTRLSDGQVFPKPPAGPAVDMTALNASIIGEGFELSTSAPSVGVNYTIEPTRNGASELSINRAVAADPRKIAAAAPSTTSLGIGNTGSLKVSQGDVVSSYTLGNVPKTFTYSAAGDSFNFGLPASAVVTATYGSGAPVAVAAGSIARMSGTAELTSITYDGITVSLSGVPANNDTFTISANINGTADSRNAVKLANLQTQSAMSGGKASYQTVFASLVSQVGATTNQIKVTGDAQQSLLTQSESARAAVSGVNLDEEAANLIRYQQAYQASAKSLEIASKLFDTILNI